MPLRLLLIFGLILASSPSERRRLAAQESIRPVEGLRQHDPDWHALVNARLVVSPERTIERGTLVLRRGVITAIGADIEIPLAARQWDLQGKTIYPGFLNAYSQQTVELPRDSDQAWHWSADVRPQIDMAQWYEPVAAENRDLRSQGFTTRLVAPAGGIIRGRSALVTTADGPADRAILARQVAMHLRLTVDPGRDRDTFPNSPMGAVALARQAFLDAGWHRDAWRAFQNQAGIPRPESNSSLQVLQEHLDDQKLLVIEAADEQYFLRADRFAREFLAKAAIRGSGHEYRRLTAIAQTQRPVILPLNFPKPPPVHTTYEASNASLEQLLHWDLAPENPARLQRAGVSLALTTEGLSSVKEFLPALRKAVQRGWNAQDALRALTIKPAQLFGVEDQIGTLDVGKLAHLVVSDGDLLQTDARVLEVWIDGTRYPTSRQDTFQLSGRWQVTGDGLARVPWQLELSLKDNSWQGTLARQDEASVPLKHLKVHAYQVSASFDGLAFDHPGVARLSLVLLAPGDQANRHLQGRLHWPDGSQVALQATPLPEQTAQDASSTRDDSPNNTDQDDATDKPRRDAADADKPATETEHSSSHPTAGKQAGGNEKQPVSLPATYEVNYPLGAFGVDQPPTQPEHVVFRNATIWTCGPQGTLADASLVISRGKITAVGQDVSVPDGAVVVDCQGKHLSPGIIDCHSHMATDGGINEATQAITAEVRIGDFLDATDISIYRQLAGGVTCANILHGSANPIGGQNQVIKLRWGALPEELKFADAPAGIKFALGENVKQSNWGDRYTRRYPQTRMGVEQLIYDALLAAQRYQRQWQQWQDTGRGLPPRRDLELEALAEVLQGKRWIHCHSYRQDEIVALLHTLKKFDVQIGTLQHVLEGYKVADILRQHGAMASAFSDWWAYKFEVYDAIPYNGALMHQAGVVVSFNSDDRELARHLNQEAAKAVKYGNVPPDEALQFVTLNPARQLRIDQHVGSLEVGKHADVVVWSAPPLSNFAACQQTWIDGRKYFDRDADRQQQAHWQSMRQTLIQKILASGEEPQSADEAQPMLRHLWPREDLFCGHHHDDTHQHETHHQD